MLVQSSHNAQDHVGHSIFRADCTKWQLLMFSQGIRLWIIYILFFIIYLFVFLTEMNMWYCHNIKKKNSSSLTNIWKRLLACQPIWVLYSFIPVIGVSIVILPIRIMYFLSKQIHSVYAFVQLLIHETEANRTAATPSLCQVLGYINRNKPNPHV